MALLGQGLASPFKARARGFLPGGRVALLKEGIQFLPEQQVIEPTPTKPHKVYPIGNPGILCQMRKGYRDQTYMSMFRTGR